MLLTVTVTGPDASGLGFLLHKHPDRAQTFTLPVGNATVFYPESSPERVTAALLLHQGRPGSGQGAYDFIHPNGIFSPDLSVPEEGITNIARFSADVV